MGNACKTLSFCDCMFPSDLKEDNDSYGYRYESTFSQPRLSKSRAQKCNVFTISSPNVYTDFSTPVKHCSFNDLQLNIDMIDSNLSLLSKDLYSTNSSFCELMDSGYESSESDSSMPSKYDMVTINLESISHYSAEVERTTSVMNKKHRSNFDLLYSSLFNMNYFLMGSVNSLLKKTALKQTLFTSKFITSMKSKLVEAENRPVPVTEEEKYSAASNTSATKMELNTFTYLALCRSTFSVLSVRNIVSRIYDINYF